MTANAASGYRSRCSILMSGGFDHSGSPEKSPIFQSKRSFHRIHPRPSRKFAGRSLFRPRYPEPQGWPRGGRGVDAATTRRLRRRTTVAGYGGPGFHIWPQATSLKTRIQNRFNKYGRLLKKRSAPRPGSASAATENPDTKPPRGGQAATVAGDVGPGFHNWPSGHIPQDTAPNPLLRIRFHAKKTFGEAFGAATGVSDRRLQKTQTRNDDAGGKAATVAGDVGPGFHTWPSGHIPQDTAPKPLLCRRSCAQKTFGGAFGAATGVSDRRLQKIRGARAKSAERAKSVTGSERVGRHSIRALPNRLAHSHHPHASHSI